MEQERSTGWVLLRQPHLAPELQVPKEAVTTEEKTAAGSIDITASLKMAER